MLLNILHPRGLFALSHEDDISRFTLPRRSEEIIKPNVFRGLE